MTLKFMCPTAIFSPTRALPSPPSPAGIVSFFLYSATEMNVYESVCRNEVSSTELLGLEDKTSVLTVDVTLGVIVSLLNLCNAVINFFARPLSCKQSNERTGRNNNRFPPKDPGLHYRKCHSVS